MQVPRQTVRFGGKAQKKAKRSRVEQAKAADDEMEERREEDDVEEDECNLQEVLTKKRKGPHAAKKAKKTKNAGKGLATTKAQQGMQAAQLTPLACAGAVAEVMLGVWM